MMNQLKSIYNGPFKSSHSHPIHTCLATIASNAYCAVYVRRQTFFTYFTYIQFVRWKSVILPKCGKRGNRVTQIHHHNHSAVLRGEVHIIVPGPEIVCS